MRVCDVCGGVDEEARHVVAHAPDQAPTVERAITLKVVGDESLTAEQKVDALNSLEDGTLQIRHIPCCAKAGCPTGTCAA
jgi:hypothetical protein